MADNDTANVKEVVNVSTTNDPAPFAVSPVSCSYKTWPMGTQFAPLPLRKLQMDVNLRSKPSSRYPAKKWTKITGEPGENIPATGLFVLSNVEAGQVIFIEEPIVFFDLILETRQHLDAPNVPLEKVSPQSWDISEEMAKMLLRQKVGGKEMWAFLWRYGKDNISLPAELCSHGLPRICSEFPELDPTVAAILINVIHSTSVRMRTPVLAMLHGLALYMVSPGINHSCDPNCIAFVGDYDDKILIIKALRCIKEGEEITISYIPAVCRLPTPYGRREVLRAIYDFTCVCRRCTADPQPRPDRRLSKARQKSIETFGVETVAKIKNASMACVQGGPDQSQAILKELGALWTNTLGNGSPEALEKMDPILIFDFSYAYLAALFMTPALLFAKNRKEPPGLSEAMELLDGSIRSLVAENFCTFAWRFAKPLLDLASFVYNSGFYPISEDLESEEHLNFSYYSVHLKKEYYEVLLRSMEALYGKHKSLAGDVSISEIVFDMTSRMTHLMKENAWLHEEVEKIGLYCKTHEGEEDGTEGGEGDSKE